MYDTTSESAISIFSVPTETCEPEHACIFEYFLKNLLSVRNSINQIMRVVFPSSACPIQPMRKVFHLGIPPAHGFQFASKQDPYMIHELYLRHLNAVVLGLFRLKKQAFPLNPLSSEIYFLKCTTEKLIKLFISDPNADNINSFDAGSISWLHKRNS